MIYTVNKEKANNGAMMTAGWKRPAQKLGEITYSQNDLSKKNHWRCLKMKDTGVKKSVREDYARIVKQDSCCFALVNSWYGNGDLAEDIISKVGHLWLMISLV